MRRRWFSGSDVLRGSDISVGCGVRRSPGLLWHALWVLGLPNLAAAAALTPGASTVFLEDIPAAVVDGVVMPAWLERSGRRQPVLPGMALQESDQIETGANARILLTLPEGSKVKLGENARLGLDVLQARREGQAGNVFLKSTLRVVIGAFRFTTNALAKTRSRREVAIRTATLTAGIRGTDLWGKQGAAEEIVCLLEGKIEVAQDPVAGQSTATLIMDQPFQFTVAPQGEASLPIGRVPDAQLALWALETEIITNAGGASVGGQWKITFENQTTFAAALSLHEELRTQGYAAQFHPDKKDGKRIYRVQLGNFSSEGDARALAEKLGTVTNARPSVRR